MPRTLRLYALDRVLIAAFALSACGGEAKTPPPMDTPATDTAQPAAPAEAAPASKVGKIPLLERLAPDGKCSVEQFSQPSAVLRNVAYDGDYPPRKITVAVGAATRTFRPINVEIRVQQDAGVGQTDGESMSVIFTADGNIQHGARTYTGASGDERTGLFPEDSARVKQLTTDVLELCKDHD